MGCDRAEFGKAPGRETYGADVNATKAPSDSTGQEKDTAQNTSRQPLPSRHPNHRIRWSSLRRWTLASLLLLGAFALALRPTSAAADRSYRVRPGDTLARIARRFHTNIPALRRANRLRGDSLRAGTRLTIPTGGSARAARRAGQHLVRRGDTLGAIARRYRVPIRELRRLNRLRGDRIRPGMRLRIPGRRRENRMPTVAARPDRPSQQGAEERAEALDLGTLQAAHKLLGEQPEERWLEAAQEAPSQVPEDAQALDDQPPTEHTPAGTLRHPLVGEQRHFMRGWGSGAGGYHLALDLYAPPGSEIRAADRAIVAYAGTGLRGYGRMLILLHPNGRVTAYAHNRGLLVRAGELVAQGQVVALLGNTGLSRGPHLHFMLIDGGEHCDPAPLLRPLPQRRNGTPAVEAEVQWDGEERPEAVRCLPRNARPHPGFRRRTRRRARR